MKINLTIVCFLLLSFPFSNQLLSQDNPTVFHLTTTNQGLVNVAIRAHMDSLSTAPDSLLLAEFLSSAYTNVIYPNSPAHCSNPGINVVQNSFGFFFTYSGFAPSATTPDALYVTQMASFGPPKRSTSVQGPRVYNGYNLQPEYAQHRLFLVGSYCSDCISPSLKSCVSDWEVIIIEKSIL